jgi:hypothetical protein
MLQRTARSLPLEPRKMQQGLLVVTNALAYFTKVKRFTTSVLIFIKREVVKNFENCKIAKLLGK